MKKMLVFLVLLTLISCGTSPSGPSIPDNIKWSIRKEVPNSTLSKCNIEVQLDQKVDEKIIREIALQLRQERKEYNKLWIMYFIPEMAIDVAWATAIFTPELEIKIIGSSDEQDSIVLQTENIDGVISMWKSEQSLMGGLMILYSDSTGKLMMKTKFTDGSSVDRLIKKTNSNGKTKYQDDNPHGEYYILEENGNLGMYGENGKYDEAAKL